MAKVQEEEHILIAVRGSLNEEVRVETIKISENDEEFDEEDFEDLGEYADYILENAAGEYEQGSCAVLTINSKQREELIRKLGGFTREDMEFSFNAGVNRREEEIEFEMGEIEEISEPNFVDWMAQEFQEETGE
jgi:hypothetical protein